MKSIAFSRRLRFLPHVGRRYWTDGFNGRRLLVVGESHYSGSKDSVQDYRQNNWLTRDVIKRQWNGEDYSYHKKVAHAIAGRPLEPREIRPFWESLAFYTFVQDIVGVGPRVRPTKALWDEGLDLLPDVIEKLKPDFVIATGSDLWKRLPSWDPDLWLKLESKRIETCVGTTESGHRFRATYMDHPASWGFGNGSRWHPLVTRFLALPLPAPDGTRKKMRA